MNAAFAQGASTNGGMFNMEGIFNNPSVLGSGTLRQKGVATGGYTGYNSGTATGPQVSQTRDITLNMPMPMPELLQNLHHHHHGGFFGKVGRGLNHATNAVVHTGTQVAGAVAKPAMAAGKYVVNHPGTIGQGLLAGAACATAPEDGGATAGECAMASAHVAAQVGSDV